MPCLVSLHGLGEEEGSPVRQTADHAAVGEDKGAGCAGDSGKKEALAGKGGRGMGGKVLFDFIGDMRFAHADLIRSAILSFIVTNSVPRLSSHTTWRRLPIFHRSKDFSGAR